MIKSVTIGVGLLFLITFGYGLLNGEIALEEESIEEIIKVVDLHLDTGDLSTLSEQPDTNLQKNVNSDTSYLVTRVVDGDTIVIDKNGVLETIRFIGIDTPETVHPTKSVECFGQESSAKTKSWLNNQMVLLEFDYSQGERDKYGRLLAYVFREDGLFVNLELLLQGYAYEYTYNLPYKYQEDFKTAEVEAGYEERGLWAPDVCNDS